MARIEFSDAELGGEGFGGDYLGPIEVVKGVDVNSWTPEDFEANIKELKDIYRYGMDLDTYNEKLYRAREYAEKVPMFKTWAEMKEYYPEITAEEYLRYKEPKARNFNTKKEQRKVLGEGLMDAASFNTFKEQYGK